MPWHPRTSLRIIGSAVQKNLSALSQAKYYSQLFTGVHHPNIATPPARYTDPGLRHSERLLDCTALSPDCRAAGSQLRMLLRPCPKSRPFPQIDPCWRQCQAAVTQAKFTIHLLHHQNNCQPEKSLRKRFLSLLDFRDLQKSDTQSKWVYTEYLFLHLKYWPYK